LKLKLNKKSHSIKTKRNLANLVKHNLKEIKKELVLFKQFYNNQEINNKTLKLITTKIAPLKFIQRLL